MFKVISEDKHTLEGEDVKRDNCSEEGCAKALVLVVAVIELPSGDDIRTAFFKMLL